MFDIMSRIISHVCNHHYLSYSMMTFLQRL